MTYLTTPYIGGNYEDVIGILASSAYGHKRIACFGDSREDAQSVHGGKHSQYQINRLLFDKFGSPSELPYAHMSFAIGSNTAVQVYLQQTGHPYIGTNPQLPAGLTPLLPPGHRQFGTHSSQHSPQCQLLPWGISRAGIPAHINETGVLQFEPNRADLVCDILCRKSTTGPAKLGYIYNPTNSTTQATFAATVASGIIAGVTLNDSDTAVVRATTPALAYQSGNPYAQVKVAGYNSAENAIVENAWVWGMRYRHSTLDRGVSYTSFAVAGSLWDNWIAALAGTTSGTVNAFDQSAAAFALMGPWHMTRLQGGVNDYSGNTLNQIEQDARDFIAAWRTFIGNPNHQIILEAPHPRTWPSTNYDSIVNNVADKYYAIAEDTPNVAFFNVARALFDEGYTPTATIWGDGIHLGQFGNYVKDQIVVDFLSGDSPYYDRCPTAMSIAASVVAAINADATQTTARTLLGTIGGADGVDWDAEPLY